MYVFYHAGRNNSVTFTRRLKNFFITARHVIVCGEAQKQNSVSIYAAEHTVKLSVSLLCPLVFLQISAVVRSRRLFITGKDAVEIAIHRVSLQIAAVVLRINDVAHAHVRQRLRQTLPRHAAKRLRIGIGGAVGPQAGNAFANRKASLTAVDQKRQHLSRLRAGDAERNAVHRDVEHRNGLNDHSMGR